MKKIRDALQFECVEGREFLSENGMTVGSSFDVSNHNSQSQRWEYKYCVGSGIIVDPNIDERVVEAIKKRIEDGIVFYLYKEVLEDLYSLMRLLTYDDREGALVKVSDLIKKISKGE